MDDNIAYLWNLAKAASKEGDIGTVNSTCSEILRREPEFWYARELPKHTRGHYSQFDQDIFIESFFSTHRPINRRFVEVGAFDGVHYSNVRRLIEKHGWTGLCIEPVQENYDKLVKSHENDGVICVQAAVGESEGTAEIYVSRYPHLPDWGSDCASLSSELCSRWTDEYGAEWRTEEVRVATLTTLLDEANIETFDFLSVDAEGHDLEVLRSLDFSRFHPQLIIVEVGTSRDSLIAFLSKQGYSVWRDLGQDLILQG